MSRPPPGSRLAFRVPIQAGNIELLATTNPPPLRLVGLFCSTGASRVFIFDHKVRRGPSNWHKLGQNNSSKRGPLHRVHVDQSYDGAEFLVNWYLPSEASNLLKGHWQIINVGQYVHHPSKREPQCRLTPSSNLSYPLISYIKTNSTCKKNRKKTRQSSH